MKPGHAYQTLSYLKKVHDVVIVTRRCFLSIFLVKDSNTSSLYNEPNFQLWAIYLNISNKFYHKLCGIALKVCEKAIIKLNYLCYNMHRMFKRNKYNAGIQAVVKTQAIFGLVCVLLIAGITRDFNSILSSLIGFGVAFSATIVYVLAAFYKGFIAYPNQVLKLHQKAVVLRFLVNLLLFMIVFISYRQCRFMLLLITYLVTLSGYWFSLLKK